MKKTQEWAEGWHWLEEINVSFQFLFPVSLHDIFILKHWWFTSIAYSRSLSEAYGFTVHRCGTAITQGTALALLRFDL